MSNRKYEIHLSLSTGDTASKAARAAASMGKIGDAAARSAAKSADAAAKSAGQQVISYENLAVKHAAYMTRREAAEKKAADRSVAEARRATDASQREGERAVAAAAGKHASGLGRAAASGTALQAALGGVAAITFAGVLKGIDDIAERIEAATEGAINLRKELREDAALVGEAGPNDKVVADHLRLRAVSGLGQREASEFHRQFEGSLPIGIQKGNIDPGTAEELKGEAATMAARVGGDAGTRGDLAGVLAQFKKYEKGDAGVKQAMGDLEAVRVGLTAGRGDDTPLTNQLLKVAGSMVREGGPLPDIRELSALIGVTSLSAGPEEAGTRAEQLARGLGPGMLKTSKAKGTLMSRAEYAKQLGIGENDSLETRLDKIAPDLAKAKAGGRNVEAYLAERNFRSEEERRAIIETIPNLDVLKQRMADSRKAGQGEALNVAREAEEAAATPDDEGVVTWLTDSAAGVLGGHIRDPAAAGRRVRHESMALDRMTEQARKLGAPEDEIRRATTWQWGRDSVFSTGPDARDRASWLSRMITDRGGVVGEGARREALGQAGAALGRPDLAAAAGARGPDAAGGGGGGNAAGLAQAIEANTEAVKRNNALLIAQQQPAPPSRPGIAPDPMIPPRRANGGGPGR